MWGGWERPLKMTQRYEVFSITTQIAPLSNTGQENCRGIVAGIRKTRGASKLASFVYYISRDLIFLPGRCPFMMKRKGLPAMRNVRFKAATGG
jgi:hypothetical protein